MSWVLNFSDAIQDIGSYIDYWEDFHAYKAQIIGIEQTIDYSIEGIIVCYTIKFEKEGIFVQRKINTILTRESLYNNDVIKYYWKDSQIFNRKELYNNLVN